MSNPTTATERLEALQAASVAARALVAREARKAARRGCESAVALFPGCRTVPSVAAYAHAIGLGSEGAGWGAVDLTDRKGVHYPGHPRGAFTLLITPANHAIRVAPGLRAADLVRAGLEALPRGLPLADLTLDHAQASYDAVGEALGEPDLWWSMLCELASRAGREGWLKGDPLRIGADDEDDGPDFGTFDPGTDDDPEPTAVAP
jgi:hypothetical protein